LDILVGDVGGTHCRLAMASIGDSNDVALSHITKVNNADYPGLGAILAGYLRNVTAPDSSCLAVAGPTDGRHVHFTNLDWHIDVATLASETGLKHLRLINDFSAVGWGLNALEQENLAILQAGTPSPDSVWAAVGAGTGLGVSIGILRAGLRHPIPTEGGHIGFAPLDATQDRLLEFMRGLFGRVSVERLLSGPGIVDLYRFCCQDSGLQDMPLLNASEPARAITQAALAHQDHASSQAMALFAGIYGQVAGDIALLAQARGGIFLAGGIPPQILPLLRGQEFLAGFHAKGRFSDWMQSVPVRVVLDQHIGLRGAALAAINAPHVSEANR